MKMEIMTAAGIITPELAVDRATTATLVAKPHEELSRGHRSPFQDPGRPPQSLPTAKVQTNKSLSGDSLHLPIAVHSCCSHREQHQVFQKPSVCFFAFYIISFPYCTFTKFGLNCSIT